MFATITRVVALIARILDRTPARQRLAGHLHLAGIVVVGGLLFSLAVLGAGTGSPDVVEWPEGTTQTTTGVN